MPESPHAGFVWTGKLTWLSSHLKPSLQRIRNKWKVCRNIGSPCHVYIPQKYLTFFNVRGCPEEQPLPSPLAIHLSWSVKISGSAMGLKSTTTLNLKKSSGFKPLIWSVQLKENQTGWNFSDAMSFPGGGQRGNPFSSSCYWKVKVLCCGSNNSCTQLLL